MTQQFGKHVFDQASKLFKDAVVKKTSRRSPRMPSRRLKASTTRPQLRG